MGEHKCKENMRIEIQTPYTRDIKWKNGFLSYSNDLNIFL